MRTFSCRAAVLCTLLATVASLASVSVGARTCIQMSDRAAQHHHGGRPDAPPSDCSHGALGSSCIQLSVLPPSSNVAIGAVLDAGVAEISTRMPHHLRTSPIFHPPRA